MRKLLTVAAAALLISTAAFRSIGRRKDRREFGAGHQPGQPISLKGSR